MLRTANDTACLLAVILKRSEQTRARISAKTIKILANRRRLRGAFVAELGAALVDGFDWILTELSSGGYGAVRVQTMEAAKAVTAKRWLSDEERKTLRHAPDITAFEAEVDPELDAPAEDDNG